MRPIKRQIQVRSCSQLHFESKDTSKQCRKDYNLDSKSKTNDNPLLHTWLQRSPSGRKGYRISEKAAIVCHLQQNDFVKLGGRKANHWTNVIAAPESGEHWCMSEKRLMSNIIVLPWKTSSRCLIWFPPVRIKLLPVYFKHVCRDNEAPGEILGRSIVFVHQRAEFNLPLISFSLAK